MDLLIGFVNSSSLTNYFNHIRKRTKFQVVWFLSLSRFKKTRSQNWFAQNAFASLFFILFFSYQLLCWKWTCPPPWTRNQQILYAAILLTQQLDRWPTKSGLRSLLAENCLLYFLAPEPIQIFNIFWAIHVLQHQ